MHIHVSTFCVCGLGNSGELEFRVDRFQSFVLGKPVPDSGLPACHSQILFRLVKFTCTLSLSLSLFSESTIRAGPNLYQAECQQFVVVSSSSFSVLNTDPLSWFSFSSFILSAAAAVDLTRQCKWECLIIIELNRLLVKMEKKRGTSFFLSFFAVVISDYPILPSLDDDDLDVDDLSLSLDFIPFTTLQNHSLSISLFFSVCSCPSLVDLCAPNRQTICCLKLKKVKG